MSGGPNTWNDNASDQNWDNADNWSTGSTPQTSDDVIIDIVDTVNYANPDDVTGLNSVSLDNATLIQSQDELSTNAFGVGTTPDTAQSVYDLENGVLDVANTLQIGAYGGDGLMSQTGGSATVGSSSTGGELDLGVGSSSGSVGELDLSTPDSGNPATLTVYGNLEDGLDPGNTGNIVIGTSGASSDPTVLAVEGDSANPYDGNLYVGDGGDGDLTLYSGALDVAYYLEVGVNGTGVVTQDGGTVTTDVLAMSAPVGGGSSTYDISGGELDAQDAQIGSGSTGSAQFDQSGGTVNVEDDFGGMYVDNFFGGSSAYTISDGALNVYNTLEVGGGTPASAPATFDQTGGVVTLASDTTNSGVATDGYTALEIGQYAGDNGAYTLDGSGGGSLTLTVNGAAVVGDAGGGTFTQTGGTLTVDEGAAGQADLFVGASAGGAFSNSGGVDTVDALVLGQHYGSSGGYTLGNDGTLDIIDSAGATGNGFLDIGESGAGAFEQDGGETTMTGSLDLGRYSASGSGAAGPGDGTLALHGGSITVGTFADIGLDGTGSVTQDSLDSSSQVEVQGAGGLGGDLNLGRNGGASGSYDISGNSTLTVDTGSLNVGLGGDGTFSQGAGSVVTVEQGNLNLGLNAGATGSYTLTGGALDVSQNTLVVGGAGSGAFTQSGGTVNAGAGLTLGANDATGATFDQTGGQVNVTAASGAYYGLVIGASTSAGTTATYTLSSASQSAPSQVIVGGGIFGGVDVGENPDSTGSLVIGTEGLATDATVMSVQGYNSYMTVGDFGNGLLTVYSGALYVESGLDIGINGTGTVTQSGGLVESAGGNVDMSAIEGAGASTYTISGGELFAGDLFVGPPNLDSGTTGTASFTQEGSSTVDLYDLNINHLDNGATSTYTLDSGTLSAAYEDVGSSGVGEFVQSGGANELTQTLIIGSGGEYDFSGGTLSASLVSDSGLLVASGTNTINANVSGAGEIDLEADASLTVKNSISGASIDFGGADSTLAVAAQSGTLGEVSGFAAGDTISLLNQDFTSADHLNYDPTSGKLTITDASSNVLATVDFVGAYSQPEFQASGTDITLNSSPPCFCAGTLIATERGEVAVETLARGDLVMTADGEAKPVCWIGRRAVSAIFSDPLRNWPIRVKAGALGDNVPSRDLLLSPDHALRVDDVLIQAGALVNGTSIVRETKVPRTFVYYHVELDDHSLILAENTPAETFVDNVDRLGFDNWAEHEALYPDGKPIDEMAYPRAKSRRQVPSSIRAALDARAKIIGAAEASAAVA